MPTPESHEPPRLTNPSAMQRRILWSALTAMAVLALVGVAGLVFFGFVAFLSWCYPILLPIGLAVIIALSLEPAVAFVQRHRHMKRENASLLVCLIAATCVLFFWAFLSGTLLDEGGKFFQNLPDLINGGLEKLGLVVETPPAPEATLPLDISPATTVAPTPDLPAPASGLALAPPPHLAAHVENGNAKLDTHPIDTHAAIQAWLKTNLPSIEQTLQQNAIKFIYSALGPVGQAFGFLLGFGFVPIYVYYFLADEELITKHWHEYVPLRRSALREEVVSVLREINASLVSYFHGQIIVAACNGVLTFIGLMIIGVPYSPVLGIITGVLSIVPFLGIVCSIIPAFLLGFLGEPMAGQPWLRPVLVLVVFALVQMSESMFITPRVQSHSTGLHPLTIIIGILFWSMLLPGLLGPIVAVPLTCAVVVLLRRYVWQLKKKPRA